MSEVASESNGFTIFWKIENYSDHCFVNDEGFESPIFFISGLNQSEWRLKLYPSNVVQSILGKSGLSIGIEIEKVGGQAETLVAITFDFVTPNGLHHLDELEESKFNTNDTFISLVEARLLESAISSSGTLTLRCHLGNKAASAFPPIIYTGSTHIGEKFTLTYLLKNKTGRRSHIRWKKIIFSKYKFNPPVEMSIDEDYARIEVSFRFLNAEEEYTYRMKIDAFAFNQENVLKYSVSKNSIVESNDTLEIIMFYPETNSTGNLKRLHFDMVFLSSKMYSQIDKSNNLPEMKYKIENILKEDKLSTQRTVRTSSKEVISKPVLVGTDSLQNDLSLLLTEKKLCDVIFKVDGKEFSAHKTIVSARSPVFCTMFESDMQEKKSGVVNIDDIDSDTFDIFLNYLYRGKTNNLNVKSAVSLYSTADKYQVLSLKKECSSFIMNHLDEENVCDVLVLSDTHHDEELKNAAQEVFCLHSKSIFLSKDWVTFFQNRPELVADTLQKMALKM